MLCFLGAACTILVAAPLFSKQGVVQHLEAQFQAWYNLARLDTRTVMSEALAAVLRRGRTRSFNTATCVGVSNCIRLHLRTPTIFAGAFDIVLTEHLDLLMTC